MGKKRISNIPSRKAGSREAGNIQLMKERRNIKDNHRNCDLQDRFINIDSTFNQVFSAA